jgi:uncharacterized protein YcbK (DUF882 family)
MTDNFPEKEFFVSSQFPHMGREMHEKATKQTKACITLLKHLILQPVRDEFKFPMIITSGFRSIPLNKMLIVLGYSAAQRSLHSLGIACDFTVSDKHQLPYIFNYIRDELGSVLGELILYKVNGIPDRIHVSLWNGRQKIAVKEE